MVLHHDAMSPINDYLAQLVINVKFENRLYRYNINKAAESFFEELLNEIWNRKLVNINKFEANAKSIDLGDEEASLCVQVTSTKTTHKVNGTLSKFKEKGWINKYTSLKVVFIAHEHSVIWDNVKIPDGLEKLDFSEKDLITVSDIVDEIDGLNGEKKGKVLRLLENQFSNSITNKTVSNEVRTILDFIQYLSSIGTTISTLIDEPDPEHKIRDRFRDFANVIEKEHMELIPYYDAIRQEAEAITSGDIVKKGKIEAYLKNISVRKLEEAQGNPVEALNLLTDYFTEELSRNNVSHDYNAIRYYLIHNLVACNVFPNES